MAGTVGGVKGGQRIGGLEGKEKKQRKQVKERQTEELEKLWLCTRPVSAGPMWLASLLVTDACIHTVQKLKSRSTLAKLWAVMHTVNK